MNDDALAAFERPPRTIPITLLPPLYFGGVFAQLGWFFFGFGMIFVWVFTRNADITYLWDFSGQLQTVDGFVINSEETNFSEGGTEHSKGTSVCRIRYRFVDKDGIEHRAECYKKGWNPQTSTHVIIEYREDRPEISRIQGTRRRPVGLIGLFLVIFPIIGAVLAATGLRRGRKAHSLLRFGHLTTGRLVEKSGTTTQINGQIVYKLTFEFTDDLGESHRVAAKTHETAKLEDEESERLLYDPYKPTYAVLIDNLPGSPAIDEHGYLCSRPSRAILSLLLPAISLIGHTITAVILGI